MRRSSWKAWTVFSNFIYSVFTLTELYLLSVLVGWWIPLRVDSKGFQLLCTHTPDLSPLCMKPCDWPLHTSLFPLDQWLHSSPTPSPPEAFAKPSQCLYCLDWKVRAAVTSDPNTLCLDATLLPVLLKLVKVLESYMTSVMDGQQVSICSCLKMQKKKKTSVKRHVKCCLFVISEIRCLCWTMPGVEPFTCNKAVCNWWAPMSAKRCCEDPPGGCFFFSQPSGHKHHRGLTKLPSCSRPEQPQRTHCHRDYQLIRKL